AVTQERQGDPRDGHDPHRHPDVDDHVCEPGAEDTKDDDPCKGVWRPLRDPRDPPEDYAEDQQDRERPEEEAEFFPDYAEDEVRVLLRQERQPLLRAQGEALAEKPAAPDRDPGLDHVPAGAARVDRWVEEDEQARLLVTRQ